MKYIVQLSENVWVAEGSKTTVIKSKAKRFDTIPSITSFELTSTRKNPIRIIHVEEEASTPKPKEIKLIKGRIYKIGGTDCSNPVIFRHDTRSCLGISKYSEFAIYWENGEAPIRPATIKEQSMLVKAEIENRLFWNGKELVKF